MSAPNSKIEKEKEMDNYLATTDCYNTCIHELGLEPREANHFLAWLNKQPRQASTKPETPAGSIPSWLWNYRNRPVLVGNAFSLNMLSSARTNLEIIEIDLDDVQRLLGARLPKSCIGHADTAEVFSNLVGRTLPMARETVTLSAGDDLLVGQYTGPRLPEGARTLPEGASIKWMMVTVR